MPRGQRSAIAIRHIAFEDVGLLAPVLESRGWSLSYREAPTADLADAILDDADLLMILGGPIGVYESDAYPFLADEVRLLERRLGNGRPTLGVCLGSQLMAKALGARVFKGPVAEIGWGRVDLTSEGRASCLAPLGEPDAVVLHWHGDTFDLPQGATRLASTPHFENQAFAFGPCALGLQFHVEADPAALEHWYVGHAAELSAAQVAVPGLRAETMKNARRVSQQAEQIFAHWLDAVSADIDA